MKRLFNLFILISLLTACTSAQEDVEEPVVEEPQEVEHLFGTVHFIDSSSVEVQQDITKEEFQTFSLSKDAKIEILKDGNLVTLPLEDVSQISLSSNRSDYNFYFFIQGGEVIRMRQANYALKEDADDDLVYLTGAYERDGKNYISVDPIDDFKLCDACSGGFEATNLDAESIEYEISEDQVVFSIIDWSVSVNEPTYPMNFDEMLQEFSENEEVLTSVPYHLKTDEFQNISLIEKLIQ